MQRNSNLKISTLSTAVSAATTGLKNESYRFEVSTLIRTLCLTASGAAFIGASFGASLVNAQDDGGVLEEVIVTGSRIQRNDYDASSPTVTVDQELFASTSSVGIETVLNQLPQFVPSLTEFNSTTVQSTATTTPGASVVNLRGLGTFRTLTLIDGRRGQPLNATLAVDTNSIPSSAIERVEIISGGASAVYGADAVAGVVNFILKDDYEGMEFTTRYGMTEEGDGEQLQLSALIGASFDDGRGNVMLGIEHADRSKAFDGNRSWIKRDLVDPDRRGTEGMLAETYINFSDLDSSARPTQAAIDSLFTDMPDCIYPTGVTCSTPAPNNKFFVNRTSDGTGSLFTGASAFISTNGNAGSYRYDGPLTDDSGQPYRKYNSDNLLVENNLSALTTVPLERYSMFARAKYDMTDNITAFIRGNFASTKTETATSFSPAVNNWTATIPVGFEGTLWPDSLNADGSTNSAYMVGGAYGLNCPEVGGCTESQAFPLPPELEMLLRSRSPETRDTDFRINRVMDYLGDRETTNRSSTFQLIAGLEGDLSNGWTWDASVGYGVSETITIYANFADLAQYKAVAESPNYGVNFVQGGLSATSSGIGLCTSGLPFFRDIQVSQDCIDTITTDMQASTRIAQSMVDINLVGDLFDMPAGTLQFAVGTDYRSWEFDNINDGLNNSTTFISQPIGLFSQGNTKGAYLTTTEIYGELLIPILRDLPLIQEFNLEIGGRYSDYNTSGGVETYKILGDWSVNDWARIRGGFNQATRAPHIAEFFLGKSLAGARLYDPCSPNDQNLDYSANPENGAVAVQTEALCRQMMTPAAERVFYEETPIDQLPAGTVAATGFRSGNPEVQPETAETWTLGVVLNSAFSNPWLEGLSTTIDYYQIEIEDLIGLQDADELWRLCIVSNDPNSDACGPANRDAFDGRLTLVDRNYVNKGTLNFSGVDVQFNWRAQFEDLGISIPGGLSLSTQLTVPVDREVHEISAANATDYTGTLGCGSELACSAYDYQAFTSLNYFYGPLTMALRWNYYPTIEAADAAVNPETNFLGVIEDYNILSLSGSYDLNNTITLRASVDNLFDVEPPLQGGSYGKDGEFVGRTPTLPLLPSESSDARYDQLGRRFMVGIDARF